MSEAASHLARVADYLQQFAQARNLVLPPLTPDGVAHVQRGSAVVSVHVLAEQGVILFLARVAVAPVVGEDVLRGLLEASFTSTGDAAFALHPDSGDLYLRILRALPGLDFAEFEDMLHTIATAADLWDDKVRHQLGRA
ncbi:MAG: CesT family type III secretion system chaperone [Kofleriaceae bacterium]|nr:CesT family type III secretion system chaperone [Kofleriaceae bacterium]MBP6838068.1 CesT family type III secretion system chaperone [Kofleriaceae bacterium]MBP9207155.1 CesT family type III secretion system chaperone [Kofleriaceae bacterium]